MRWVAALVACGTLGGNAVAQDLIVSGVVVLPDGRTPAPAILIEINTASGAIAARSLTGADGTFRVALESRGPFTVRALRVGYRPTVVRSVSASPDPDVLRIVLGQETFRLSAARISTDDVCGIDRESGGLVATAWEEVRKALASSGAGAGESLSTRVMNWRSQRRADGEGPAWQRFGVATFDSPPRSAEPVAVTLAVPAAAMTAPGGAVDYFGPDAEQLVSERFAATHCFRLVGSTAAHSGELGVAVRPAQPGRSIVEFAGTFWIDTATSALRRFEYRFTNGPPEYEIASAGGWMEFDRLSTGRWLVRRWALRAPAPLTPAAAVARWDVAGRRRAARLMEVTRSGGTVVSVTHAGRELLTPATTVFVRVRWREPRGAFAGATVELPDAGLFGSADASGVVAFPDFPVGRHIALASTAAMRAMLLPPIQATVASLGGPGVAATIDLPTDHDLLVDRCGADADRFGKAAVYGQLTGADPLRPVVASVTVSWLADADRGTARANAWEADSTALRTNPTVPPNGRVITVDPLGRWYTCEVPRGASLLVAAHHAGSLAPEIGFLRVSADARLGEVILRPDSPP